MSPIDHKATSCSIARIIKNYQSFLDSKTVKILQFIHLKICRFIFCSSEKVFVMLMELIKMSPTIFRFASESPSSTLISSDKSKHCIIYRSLFSYQHMKTSYHRQLFHLDSVCSIHFGNTIDSQMLEQAEWI